MQKLNPQPFSKVRSFFWPIYGYEHRKLVPMFVLFFLISFVYNVLRCMKVTLVVTAAGSSAEVIPFLKVWAVLPGAICLTYLYTRLSNFLTREQVFYAMIGIFLGFFTLFMLVLHPYREALELQSVASFLHQILPDGFKGLIAVIHHWHLSLFYVLSEMWSAVVLSMLFWGFANEVTTVDEAKRFYAIFALGANSSGIFSGQCARFLTLDEFNPAFPFGHNAWDQSLVLQLTVVLLMGFAIILLYSYVNRKIVPDCANTKNKVKQANQADTQAEKDLSRALSLRECFSHLIKSRYMVYITILVISYNIMYNLSDVLWTEQVRARYPNSSDFNAYINQIASITGIFATLSALTLSGNVIRRYGWAVTALITPVIWLITSLGVFSCLLFSGAGSFADFMYSFFGMPATTLALTFASAQICLGRAAKYTVFDESKEIAFIPLPREQQRKGKAVVDGIASRFGKSGGSIVIQVLLVICGELMLTIPYIAGIFMVVIFGWLMAIRGLGKLVTDTIDRDVVDKEKIGKTEQQPIAASTF